MCSTQPYLGDKLSRIRAQNHISTFWTLVLVACTFTILTTHADARRVPEGNSLPIRALHRDECGFVGNPDLYGLGIRAGYYSQLIATFLSNIYTRSDTRGVRTVNLWFELSLFAGLIFQATQEDFYAVESCVVVVLLLGFSYTNVWSPSVYLTSTGDWRRARRKPNTCARLTIIMSSLMHLTVPSYSVWFWWKGMDLMLSNPCATFGFFFSKVHIFHWYRMLNKTLSLGVLVFISISVVRSTRGVIRKIRPPKNRNRSFVLYYFDALLVPQGEEEGGIEVEEVSPEQPPPEESPENPVHWYNFLITILPPGLIVYTVLSVEFTLEWNKVTGVNDLNAVGQLIPFVLGVGNLMQVSKNIYLKSRKRWAKKLQALEEKPSQSTSHNDDLDRAEQNFFVPSNRAHVRQNTDTTLVAMPDSKDIGTAI